jgi:hypothetical protein
LRLRCNKNKMDYNFRAELFQHYYFFADILCRLIQAQQIIFSFRPIQKIILTYKAPLFEARPHSVIAKTPVRWQYEMDWWAMCVPRAACLILVHHSSFNSTVTSNTVKLSDIWWENMNVWMYHCKVTSCTEPDNAHITSTLRRVRSTIVVVEKLYYMFWACVCSLWYPECNAYVP